MIHVALASVGAQACYVPTRGALEFRACGALDVGDMYALVPGALKDCRSNSDRGGATRREPGKERR